MNRADVIEFLELHAKAASAAKRMKELRPALLSALQEGETSPADLPYLLELGNQARTEKDYETPLRRLLKRLYGKVRGEKRMQQIEAKFGHTDVPTLNVKKNDAYAASLGDQISAA